MKISKQAQRDAKQLFRGCLIDGLLDENRVRVTLEKILESKPRGYLQIASQFHRLVKLDIVRRAARIESPSSLPEDLRLKVSDNLRKAYGPGLAISFAQNPALIGGLRIKVGSDVYDGSVLGRLHTLEETFDAA